MHDHRRAVNARRAPIGVAGLMPAGFRPTLRRMRNLLIWTAAASTFGVAMLGCGGKGKMSASTSGSISAEAAGMKVDRTRCEERGKQVVVSDTNGDQKPDVTKLYDTTSGAGGEKTQVLACKQVD